MIALIVACLALLVALAALWVVLRLEREFSSAVAELNAILDAITLANMPPDAILLMEDGEEAELRFDRSN